MKIRCECCPARNNRVKEVTYFGETRMLCPECRKIADEIGAKYEVKKPFKLKQAQIQQLPQTPEMQQALNSNDLEKLKVLAHEQSGLTPQIADPRLVAQPVEFKLSPRPLTHRG